MSSSDKRGSKQLLTTIATTFALLDAYLNTLSPTTSASVLEPPPSSSTPSTSASKAKSSAAADVAAPPSPLPQLSAATALLKAQMTKLSLLALTPPFTPTAISSTLTTLNTSILPSLMSSALLLSPADTPASFRADALGLVRAALRDLQGFVRLVESEARNGEGHEPPASAKAGMTEATGRVWAECDALVDFAAGGVAGWAVQRTREWLELIRDAVKEVEEWDPEDDEDDDDDAGVWGGEVEEGRGSVSHQPQDEESAAAAARRIQSGVKEQALKVLAHISQSIHVVLKQRLEKLPQQPQYSTPPQGPATAAAATTTITSQQKLKRDNVLAGVVRSVQAISEHIDDCAEALYMGDVERCLKSAGEARACTIALVRSVLNEERHDEKQGDAEEGREWKWEGSGEKEDEYVRRALQWIQKVEL